MMKIAFETALPTNSPSVIALIRDRAIRAPRTKRSEFSQFGD
jgi:hypothetical protein